MLQGQTKHLVIKVFNFMNSEWQRKSSGIEKGESVYWNNIFFLGELVIKDIKISWLIPIFGAERYSETLSLFQTGKSKISCF